MALAQIPIAVPLCRAASYTTVLSHFQVKSSIEVKLHGPIKFVLAPRVPGIHEIRVNSVAAFTSTPNVYYCTVGILPHQSGALKTGMRNGGFPKSTVFE